MTDPALEAAQHAYPGRVITRAILITEHILDDGTRALVSTGSSGMTLWDGVGMLECAATEAKHSYVTNTHMEGQ